MAWGCALLVIIIAVITAILAASKSFSYYIIFNLQSNFAKILIVQRILIYLKYDINNLLNK